jgi:predicted site-specific integrase-resolvase
VHDRRLVVPGNSGVTGDLAGGLAEVLAWLCARLYGRGPVRNRALKAVGCAKQGVGPRAVKVQRCGGGG